MTAPYRAHDAPAAPEPRSGELVYRPAARNDRISAGGSGFRLFAPPTIVAVAVGKLWSVEAGVAAFALLVGAALWWSRRRPADVVVLRVDRGELRVLPYGSSRETLRVHLDDLDDVVLETKSVERAMDVGSNAVNIGMGPLSPNIAPKTDTKRIALRTSKRREHALTTEFYGHTDSTEWFAKIRRFLRSVGWTPREERIDEDEEAPESDE